MSPLLSLGFRQTRVKAEGKHNFWVSSKECVLSYFFVQYNRFLKSFLIGTLGWLLIVFKNNAGKPNWSKQAAKLLQCRQCCLFLSSPVDGSSSTENYSQPSLTGSAGWEYHCRGLLLLLLHSGDDSWNKFSVLIFRLPSLFLSKWKNGLLHLWGLWWTGENQSQLYELCGLKFFDKKILKFGCLVTNEDVLI
jgi:hypothetical protein